MSESEEYDFEDGFLEPPDMAPDLLRFSIGGREGSYGINWSADNQILRVFNPKEELTAVTVSSSQWKTFWFVTDYLRVWEWKSNYENPNAIDGTSWELVMVDGSRRICSKGSNAYPGGFEENDENSPFNQFLAAINMLTGQDGIR